MPPTDWRLVAVPLNWDPSAPERLNFPSVHIPARFMTLPSDFFMTIRTPEMLALDTPTAIIVSFRTTPAGAEVLRITGMGPDWTSHLPAVVGGFPPSAWERRAEDRMAQFLQHPEARAPIAEEFRKLPLRRMDIAPTPPSVMEAGIQRRRKITPEHLEEVAKVYRNAQANDDPPTRAVQIHFAVSHSTAAKWVGAARKAELLPPHED